VLELDGKYQACAGYKETARPTAGKFSVSSYYSTEWKGADAPSLRIEGLSTDEVYENLVRQIAGSELISNKDESLCDTIKREERRKKLQRKIDALKRKIRKKTVEQADRDERGIEKDGERVKGFVMFMEDTPLKIDSAFLTYACNILAKTDSWLSGTKIVEYCCQYAIDYNKKIPYGTYPFDASNKRTALLENLKVFDALEQFQIIKDLCELSELRKLKSVQELKIKLYERYGKFAGQKFSETELIQNTKHWLSGYPTALKQYESALTKYEGGIFERNTLDDIRLAFELLVKALLNNDKSLENQIAAIGSMLKDSGASAELRNMITVLIRYYTDFQNNHVKHNDAVNDSEIEYVIELTSVIMKFLIKVVNGGTLTDGQNAHGNAGYYGSEYR